MDTQTQEVLETMKTELARLKQAHPEQYLELIKTLNERLDRIFAQTGRRA